MSTQQDRFRGYVGNLGTKAPADLATTGNVTLSGEQTIDGTVTSESRVLVKNNTTASENGLYITSTGNWERAPDMDGTYDVEAGTLVAVGGGTVNGGSIWIQTAANPTVDTDSITFERVFDGTQVDALFQTLTDGATISWNVANGSTASVTLGGNRAMAAPTNMVAGRAYSLIVEQDATGSRTLTWNAVFKWPNGAAPTLSTTANAIDVLSFVYDGTNVYGVVQKAFG